MYDSPKAVHFDAYLVGFGKIYDQEPIGLRARWECATLVEQQVTYDMLRITEAEREEIRNVLREYNRNQKLVVTLAGYNENWATGGSASGSGGE